MADVFLSYSRQNLERAKHIVRVLEQEGLTVFWDRRLLPGERYRLEIAARLAEARCVIVLWSEFSVDSAWVIDEAELGRAAGRLVSVLIDEVQLPLGFGQGHAANLVGWDGHASTPELDALVEGVRHVVGPRAQEAEPEEPEVPDEPGAVPEATPEAAPEPVAEEPARTPPVAVAALDVEPVIRERRFASSAVLASTVLLAVVFAFNYVQTATDTYLTPAALGEAGGYPIADAFRWFERELDFEYQDVSGPIAYVGYSVSYFLLFPIVCIGVAVALARRRDPFAYRAFCLAIAINYAVSLPFFIAFPVPERWAFPGTGAMLLSDKWSDSLIEAVRPISGLDNCFPSFHTSLSVLVATACWMFGVRLRAFVTVICSSVVLATFALGIHWVPDIIAGIAIGVGSLLAAVRWMRRGASSPAAGLSHSPG